MNANLASLLRALERRLATVLLSRRREHPALLVFRFHGLFLDAAEAHSADVDPFHPFLVDDFRRFIEYYAGHGYRFVTPQQILAGLEPTGHFVWITFDDGYANNLRALPILLTFGAPATFFVSSNHVIEGKAFWWDALYRERRALGILDAAIRHEQAALKSRSYRDIEAYIRTEFGRAALDSRGDADRPMTEAELKAIAREPLVALGNHTGDHAILTRYADGDVRAQIRACQDYLSAVAGVPPDAIAYPGGSCDARVVRLAREADLRLGVGTVRGKTRLPLAAGATMTIKRYRLSSGPDLLGQCLVCRSDLRAGDVLRRTRAALK